MGQETFKGNEAKSKMKQPSDMPTPRFEHGWQWYVVQHGSARPRRRPSIHSEITRQIYRYIVGFKPVLPNNHVK